jgi:dienelactone hydrolase
MDSLEDRWMKLQPHVQVFGPEDDDPRPAVLLFHGCGGVRSHITGYAEAAAEAGLRAFVVDSYGPRGWNRPFALATVCTGVIFRGRERAGDVLAALWGVARRRDVDHTSLAAAGWSHGGWGIMELMSSPLSRAGEFGLADPQGTDLSGLKATVLVYPYVGIGATARMRPWRRCPKTLAVIAEQDHLTSVDNAQKVYDAVKACGVEVQTWQAAGTHAFDEPGGNGPMKYDEALTKEAYGRFVRFLQAALIPQPEARPAPKRRARAASPAQSAQAG